MGAYDAFVAAMRCPRCGTVCAPDGRTDMQTALRERPEMAYLTVGDRLRILPQVAVDAGYALIGPASADGEQRVLQNWSCPACRNGFNWALIRVRDGVIADISPVALDRATLEGSQYIKEEDGRGAAMDLAGSAAETLEGEALIRFLREHLP